MSHIVDDEPPIKSHPANQAYRDNYDRIFGKKDECECPHQDANEPASMHDASCPAKSSAAADPDAIECRLNSYANLIPAGPVAVIADVEDPAGIEIGWLCPCCAPTGDEDTRRVCVIDREARIFRCEYVHNEDPIEHKFDDAA